MNILLDTNLWVSALVSSSMRTRIQRIIADESITILATNELLDELLDVCTRPKFAHLLKVDLLYAFLQILKERLTFIETQSVFQICRDPDDDFLLAICHDGAADYLLTGDSDLLDIRVFQKTKILTLTEFEQLFYPY